VTAAVTVAPVATAGPRFVGNDGAGSGANQTARDRGAGRTTGEPADQGTGAGADQGATGNAILTRSLATRQAQAERGHNGQSKYLSHSIASSVDFGDSTQIPRNFCLALDQRRRRNTKNGALHKAASAA
jgi:hypothetical protein